MKPGWAVVIALGLWGCKSQGPAEQAPVAKPAAVVEKPRCVPKTLVAHQGTPKIDGEMDEPVWLSAAATEPFVHETANRVVPHTEVRAAWDVEALYLVIYVADADLRSDDQVAVAFGSGGTIAVDPNGKTQCRFGAQQDCTGVVMKLERDGDVDGTKEEDEEWAVELKVPWKLIGAEGKPSQLPVNFTRLETLEGVRLKEVWSRTCGALQLE